VLCLAHQFPVVGTHYRHWKHRERGESDKLMSYTPEDRIREEQVRRLTTDEDPRGRQHREDIYPAHLTPKKAKTRDRGKEEKLRIKMLTYEQASD
jgi:hypothetical protein